MPPTKLQAIVFDFDGVIADSEPLHLRAYQTVLRNAGVELSREDYYGRYLGFDDEEMFRKIAEDRGMKLYDDQIEKLVHTKSEQMEKLLTGDSILFPGAEACIRRCAAQLPLAIASGALAHEIELILHKTGLRDCFAGIASASDGVRGKPAPDLYFLAVAKLREEFAVSIPACVAIEDSLWGIDAAHQAGLRCLAVTHSYPASELGAADCVLDSLDEITIERLTQICGS